MVIKAEDLIRAAKRDVGVDAYLVYPDSLRAIPDTVLWGFASACILEFVKPFVDFKGIGENARKQLAELLDRWRRRRDFEEFCRSEGLDASVTSAMEMIPERITDVETRAGTDGLAAALAEIGMDIGDARILAEKIGRTVKSPSKA